MLFGDAKITISFDMEKKKIQITKNSDSSCKKYHLSLQKNLKDYRKCYYQIYRLVRAV